LSERKETFGSEAEGTEEMLSIRVKRSANTVARKEFYYVFEQLRRKEV